MPIFPSPLPSGEGVIWCSGLSAALTLALVLFLPLLLPTNRCARNVLCSNPLTCFQLTTSQAKTLPILFREEIFFCASSGHSFCKLCLQAPYHHVYYEAENVVARDEARLLRLH